MGCFFQVLLPQRCCFLFQFFQSAFRPSTFQRNVCEVLWPLAHCAETKRFCQFLDSCPICVAAGERSQPHLPIEQTLSCPVNLRRPWYFSASLSFARRFCLLTASLKLTINHFPLGDIRRTPFSRPRNCLQFRHLVRNLVVGDVFEQTLSIFP